MIAAVKSLDLGEGRTATVRELTVGEIRVWLKELTLESTPDLVTEALFDEVSLGDLARMTDLTVGDMDALLPSQLRLLMETAREINRDFFALRAKLTMAARTMAAELPAIPPMSLP